MSKELFKHLKTMRFGVCLGVLVGVFVGVLVLLLFFFEGNCT